MWWFIGITVILFFAFIWFLNRGSDMKNNSNYARNVEDDEQEAAVRKML